MKKILFTWLSCLPLFLSAQQSKIPATPDKIYGQLFQDVQLQNIFPDGKTFVDCTPKRKAADIMYDYGMLKGPGMDLKKFVEDNFTLPAAPQFNYIQKEKSAAMHIKNLWGFLKRDADKKEEGSSLLPLPYPYMVPGGRFREMYYWDSYFTMLGLKESGETVLIENIVQNFAYLIDQYGHIPNGNRSYYVSRSQPPFFCLMIELLAGIKGNGIYKKYLPQMKKEYTYWMEGADAMKEQTFKRVVKMPDGSLLNRYWDESSAPRQESYKEDYEVAEAAAQNLAMLIRVASPEKLKQILDERRAVTCRHLRAGAASGWDFSSRWFTDAQSINSIETTNIVPVDLNSLLYSMEQIIAKASGINKDNISAKKYLQKASRRKAAINKYCWQPKPGFFLDYNIRTSSMNELISVAGLFPLFVNLATPAQAASCAAAAKQQLLKEGGLVTTTNNSGQQWDAPNGWAPLQWIAVTGLKQNKQPALAKIIGTRWLSLNDKVYASTGKMMEKYNVEDLSQAAGGGEYPSQDGFGWTNGVYLALKKLYPDK